MLSIVVITSAIVLCHPERSEGSGLCVSLVCYDLDSFTLHRAVRILLPPKNGGIRMTLLRDFYLSNQIRALLANRNEMFRLAKPAVLINAAGKKELLFKNLLRRGWDSNPRYRCRYTTFPGWPIQPLLHLSGKSRCAVFPAIRLKDSC